MNIDEEFYEYALRVLQWLAFSACPVKLGEVAESIAVDLAGHPKFVLERRLREPRNILQICSSLVTVSPRGEFDVLETLRLAHFSVKEYLI